MDYAKVISKLRELTGIPRQLTEIRESIEQEGNATRAAYERNQRQEREQRRRVEVASTDEEIRQRQAEQERPNRIQNSIRRAAWATFLAAFVYGGITFLLWLNARDQLEMEQRSWLVFDPNQSDTLVLGANKAEILVPLRLVNIGRTPARAIDGFVIVEELKSGERPTFIYRKDRATKIEVGIIYPSSELAQTTEIKEWLDGHQPSLVTESKRTEFKQGNTFFNVWGRLTYVDVFHQKHFVQFCHAVAQNPSGKTKECADYNMVDAPNRWDSLKE